MKYEAVIWDLDGTLMNTSEGVLRSVAYTIETLGQPPLPREKMERFIGPPIVQSFVKICNMNPEQAAHAADIFRMRYSTVDLMAAIVYPGIFDVLKQLKQSDVKIGVATYKREDYARKLLEEKGISDYCQSTRGADFENRKTKQDILLECLEELRAGSRQPLKAVLIGDTEHDASGAYQAGVPFLAVTYGYGFRTPEDVNQFAHIGVAEKPDDLMKFLK